MTASRLQTVLVNPVLNQIAVNITNSPNNRIMMMASRERVRVSGRAISEMLGRPEPGEITKLSEEDDLRNCTEFKRKYNFDIKSERFIGNNNNHHNHNNHHHHNNSNSDAEITTTTDATTTLNNINIITKGQDNESNKIQLNVNATTTTINSTILDNESLHQFNESTTDNNQAEDNNCNNKNQSLNGGNKFQNSLNKCDDVMCNQINSTTTTATPTPISIPIKDTNTITSLKDKKSNDRFTPYPIRRQPLISEMLKSRKASPVDVPRPQKAKLQFDETHQQQISDA